MKVSILKCATLLVLDGNGALVNITKTLNSRTLPFIVARPYSQELKHIIYYLTHLCFYWWVWSNW